MLASVPETNDVYPLLGRPQDSMPSEGQEDGYACENNTLTPATGN